MRSFQNQNPSQAREGVELWELGESLGGVVGVIDPEPTHSAHPSSSLFSSSLPGSETSSSGSSCSCSSTSLGRPRLHAALSVPLHVSRPPAATWLEEDEEDDTVDEETLMSLRERDPHLGPLHQGLTRSHSFGGLLMTPGSRRSTPGGTLRSGWAGMGVLGQGPPPSPRDLRKNNTLPPHVKVPKTPRPQRACLVAGAVAKGVKECIAVTRKDLVALTRAQQDYKRAKSQGRVYEMEKQMKAAERYLKKLEYLLSHIEDLYDQYTLNQRLRDGVRTMAYAYALSPGKEKVSALNNVRSGYRECIDTLCGLEVQIEQLIGTLTLEMKGIQGFARLCPGDVFEVVIKHGTQKWKTKGRVSKDNSQMWDNPVYVFKSLLGEMLVIKALEVRLLGKTVMIGNKICETKDLFSPHPQLMTVNLNSSGSLKLNVVITWNPLDGGSDDTLVRTPSISGPSPRGSRRSVIHSISSSPPPSSTTSSLPHCIKDLHISPDCDQDSSFGSMSARSSTADSASPVSEYRGLASSQALSTRTDSNSPICDMQGLGLTRRSDSHDSLSYGGGRDSASPQCDDTGNFTLVRKQESRIEQWARYSQYNSSQASSIDIISRSFPNLATSNALHSPGSVFQRLSPAHSPVPLSTKLSPAHSQLLSQSLAHQLNLLNASENECSSHTDPLAWDCAVPSSLPKVVVKLRSCLEDIQGQFPQLHSLEEAVLDLHDMCRNCRSRRDSNTSEISLSVESALECFDFLNAECDDDFADDNPEECLAKNRKESLVVQNAKELPEVPPQIVVTASPQLDAFLLVHLQHCFHLLQDLGSFGPLRRKERESLMKLEREGKLLAVILAHRHNFLSLKPQHIMPVPHVQVLWDSVAAGDDWCVVGRSVVDGLLMVVSSLVEPTSEDLARNVLEELVRQMTDSDIYSHCLTVTAGHFLSNLLRPLQEIVPEICSSLICASLLAQINTESVEKGLSQLKIANLMHTRLISQLISGPTEFASIVISFLNNNSNNSALLTSIYDGCMLLLESTNPGDRATASTLLGHLFPLLPKEEETSVKNNEVAEQKDNRTIDKKTKDETNKDQKMNDDKLNKLRNSDQTNYQSISVANNVVSNGRSPCPVGDSYVVGCGEPHTTDKAENTKITLAKEEQKSSKEVETSSKEAEKSSKDEKRSSKEVEKSSKEEKKSSKEVESSSKEEEKKNCKEEEKSSKEVEKSSKEVEKSSKEEEEKSSKRSDNEEPTSKQGLETPLPIAVLSFLQQNDPSEAVRQCARLALLNLGTEGKEALQQVELSSHGFQGIHVREGCEGHSCKT